MLSTLPQLLDTQRRLSAGKGSQSASLLHRSLATLLPRSRPARTKLFHEHVGDSTLCSCSNPLIPAHPGRCPDPDIDCDFGFGVPCSRRRAAMQCARVLLTIRKTIIEHEGVVGSWGDSDP
eukprot:scaffold312803_cov32-Tisochrysis_lutea.AAC.3